MSKEKTLIFDCIFIGGGCAGLESAIDLVLKALTFYSTKNYVVLTDEGLAVDEEHRLLGKNDMHIPGLFAAGSVGQGRLIIKGQGHHIGWAFTSGRRAGKNATKKAGINQT